MCQSGTGNFRKGNKRIGATQKIGFNWWGPYGASPLPSRQDSTAAVRPFEMTQKPVFRQVASPRCRHQKSHSYSQALLSIYLWVRCSRLQTSEVLHFELNFDHFDPTPSEHPLWVKWFVWSCMKQQYSHVSCAWNLWIGPDVVYPLLNRIRMWLTTISQCKNSSGLNVTTWNQSAQKWNLKNEKPLGFTANAFPADSQELHYSAQPAFSVRKRM